MPERQCATCTLPQQRAFGCDAVRQEDGSWLSPSLESLVIDGEERKDCPRRPVKDDPQFYSELFQLYCGFKNGILPDEGSIASQSARGWKLLNLLDAYVNEAESEKLARARGKS